MASGKVWTEEEQVFLERHAGIKTLKWIGRKLGRTEQSVKDHLRYTGESTMVIHGLMTPAEVAAEYGCSKEHVYSLVKRGLLKARRRQSRTSRMWIDPVEAAKLPKDVWHREYLRRGQKHHFSTVSEKQAVEILKSPSHVTHSELAAQYGTTKCVVAGIRQRRTWKHLQPKEWWEPRVSTGR